MWNNTRGGKQQSSRKFFLMYKEMTQMIYLYIIKAEMVFLRYYKTNPFEIMNQLSLIDLNMYMQRIEHDEKQEQKSMKNSKIMECLKNISDYLNVMFYKK